MTPAVLKVATYNVHRCIGVDGRHDPSRIAQVLQEIDADIVGLQEVDTSLFFQPPGRVDRRRSDASSETLTADTSFEPVVLKPVDTACHQLDYLTRSTGLTAIEGLLIERKTGLFGNVLLTSFPVGEIRRLDLTIRGGRQRRGALDVDLQIGTESWRVFVAHLGLGLHERYFQIRRLVRALGNDRHSRILMMGDFNIWTSLFPRFRRLHRRLGPVPLVTTFPSVFPLLPLDRIWLQPMKSLVSLKAHNTPLSRVASDHLPLVATIGL